MNIDKILTDECKNKIKDAVKNAEKLSGGEIVPFITQESDNYSGTYWLAGFLSTLLGSVVFIFLYKFFQLMTNLLLYFFITDFFFPLLIIALLYFIKPLHLLLINKNKLDYHIGLKAREAFLNEEVFSTKDRTGILIYISLFEKKVVVLGDSGINNKVSKHKWDNVVQTMIKEIKNNSLVNGIISGISLCGNILKENKVKRRINDKNELNDDIRIRRKK